MKKNVKDRHLDVPSEANRDKHINFEALENNDEDLSTLPETGALSGKIEGRDSEGRKFHLVVDSVPYVVKAIPFSFNDETRFYITVNEGPEHVFIWDREVGGLRALDSDAASMPASLEEAISERLQSTEED